MEGRSVGRYRALNEVVVARGASARVVALDVAVDGHRVFATRADGVIVATATGSTAYALSAGGPVVAPDFGGMVVVPVAPHTLQTRALVTGRADTVEITLPDPSRAEACVVVDGEATPCRRSIESVTVTRGDHDVLLVKLDGRDFYQTVAEEFFGGAR
jgi:NAD+ kinase